MSADEGTVLRGGTDVGSGAEVIANHAARGLVPGFGGRVSAALVWDGTDEVRIPEAMGKPREDQMRGTVRERLVELSGRLCYESMGKGRSSADYAKHLLDVGHLSVLEHAAFTIDLSYSEPDDDVIEKSPLKWPWVQSMFVNHPGTWVGSAFPRRGLGGGIRVTMNLRSLREWFDHGTDEGELPKRAIGRAILEAVQPEAPGLLAVDGERWRYDGGKEIRSSARLVEPECDEEKWISLYLVGSRGWGNELCRHRMGAISQRSTRYVEESESEWVLHPLLAARGLDGGDVSMSHGIATDVRTALGSIADKIAHYVNCGAADRPGGVSLPEILQEVRDYADFWRGLSALGMVAQEARIAYNAVATRLIVWLKSKGVDATSARKQARGAARSVLGLGLETEIIYSASVKTWRHILQMRAADAADAEIRLGFAEAVLPCLKASRYGDRFADFELVPASDQIGRSLKGGGHR